MQKAILDMDGVLTNFAGGLLKAHGHHDYEVFLETWPDGQYLLQEVLKLTWEELISYVSGEEFWVNLEWMPDGREILQIVESYFAKEDIHIWTKPMEVRGCREGKTQWIAKHMPEYVSRLHIGNCKELAAKPCTILIDDSEENIEAFANEGGKVCLVPRKWNRHFVIADENSSYYVRSNLRVQCQK